MEGDGDGEGRDRMERVTGRDRREKDNWGRVRERRG